MELYTYADGRKLYMNPLIKRMVEKDFQLKNNHLASALSCLPIIENIYLEFDWKNDVFLLSKGHGCFALYAVLEKYGYHPDWTKIHPDRDIANGITNTSGSLGHGLPLGVGIALARKLRNLPGQIFVLMGDGECQEGSVWEAMLIAERFELNNLWIYIDRNMYQGITENMYDAPEKLFEVFPGVHIIICHTKRWEGLSLMDGKEADTVHEITPAEYEQIKEML